MSLLNKIRNKKSLTQFADSYGYFSYPILTGPIKNRMTFQGKEVIVWSFNDYLGLSSDKNVIEVEMEATKKFGASYPGGSRVMIGNTDYHEELEDELTKIIGKPSMLLNLCYVGSISIIQSLLDRNDIVVYDQGVHASIIDGVRLHIGDRLSFKHNDVEQLEIQLKRAKKSLKNNGQVLVVVDGVYSMGGDLAKLREIIDLKKIIDFTLLVDDSHGFLVFGEQGTPGHFGVMNGIDIYLSTFGKALGNVSGFVSADPDFINYFKYNLRSQLFARSPSIINVISVLFKLGILRRDNERRNKLWINTKELQEGLKKYNFNIGNTNSPITPVYIDNEKNAAEIIRDLREEYNIFCSGVTYPIIEKGKTLIRLTPTSNHSKEDILLTLESFSKIRNKYLRE